MKRIVVEKRKREGKKKKKKWMEIVQEANCFVEQTTNALRFFLRFHARSRNETFITRRGDTPRSFVVEIFKRTVFFFFFFFLSNNSFAFSCFQHSSKEYLSCIKDIIIFFSKDIIRIFFRKFVDIVERF